MKLVDEKPANIKQYGQSYYLFIPREWYGILGLDGEMKDVHTLEEHDVRMALGIGKHGAFIFQYSPKVQKDFAAKHCGDCGQPKVACKCKVKP